MNKELLKKAEELLPKERNVKLEKNKTYFASELGVFIENAGYNQHRELACQALPAIIELVSKEILDLVSHEMILHTPLKIEETSGTDFDKGYIFYQNMVIAGFKSVEGKLLDKQKIEVDRTIDSLGFADIYK